MIPAIICGGQGTRLWPVSRATYPKPFCDFLDETLLQKTIQRLRPKGEPWLVTSAELRGLSYRLFRDLNLDVKKVLFEPVPKNTAPAIALLCHILNRKSLGNEIVGVFPADHLVEKPAEFLKALGLAEKCAEAGQICTLGIKPTFPATGYGYIEIKDHVFKTANSMNANAVAGFREKPDLATAERFVKEGRFFWNAGIFVFKVSTMSEAFARLMPALWSSIQNVKDDLSNLGEVYKSLGGDSSKSIDYGIMEKLENQVCVPCDLGWSDVGSWDELSKLDEARANSKTFGENVSQNWVYTMDQKKVVGLIGVKDLLVVDTNDALLISKKGESQRVGELTKTLSKEVPAVTKEHPFDFRPWGTFDNIHESAGFKVKVITVDPGQQFSYQSHAKRAEHWVVVKGQPIVILNEKDHHLKPGDYIFIPLGAKHRMRNEGRDVVEFVEVQVGPYLGEDDIVRYDDDYGRKV